MCYKAIKFNKFSITVTILVLLIVCLASLNVVQYINNDTLQKNIDTKVEEIEKRQKYRVDYIIAKVRLDFYEKYAVLVNEDSKKYHKYGCDDFDESSFGIYSLDVAKQNGYHACPKCH